MALQRALHQLAKPFYRWKALNIFRDETSLAANLTLWPSIERALAESRFLIFLACPESAASPWCQKEIAWWFVNRSSETLLIVLTGADLAYDEERHDFDWSHTSALPRLFEAKFSAEPLYCDLRWATDAEHVSANEPRFRAEVLPLAAALHDKEPQELDSDDLRQFRRARLFWRSAAAGLAVLTAISLTAAWFADRKSREAERERAIAVARQLASEAETARIAQADQLPRSVLLSIEAARRMMARDIPSAQVDHTLRQGLALLPRRPGTLAHANAVDVAVSSDGNRAVSVSLDGSAGVWDLSSRREIARLVTGMKASKAAVSPDLGLIALAVEKEVVVWQIRDRRVVGRVTHKSSITSLAFNPDGTRWPKDRCRWIQSGGAFVGVSRRQGISPAYSQGRT